MRACSVETIPGTRLLDTLKQNFNPGLIADAIVCFVEQGVHDWDLALYTRRMAEAQRVALEIRRLPEPCAMQDGRKWRSLPVIIVLSDTETVLVADELRILASSEAIVFVEALDNFDPTFRAVDEAVRAYRQRVLGEFSNLGFLVTYKNGLYRVGPAMLPTGELEGHFYYGPRDKRDLRARFFTVDRDLYGTQHEVEQFEALINDGKTSEADLQRFFEDHQHFLADIRFSSAMPHVPLQSESGPLLVPDFIIKPVVAYQRDSNWEILDLKKPDAKLLHVWGLSKVTLAQSRALCGLCRSEKNLP